MDQRAFLEHAIEQYGKATYNFAFRLTRNEADAADLTQEAFIRVYRAWQSFKPGTSFLSWIYRIVTNLHRDELRRRKGRFFQEEIPEQAVQPIEEYVDAQLSEPVSRALADLAPGQRTIVELADIDGCSYQEIGQIVGCSVGTVRSRLHRARGQLRKLVKEYMKLTS
ncbi:MAG: sigma-70 family RNA polymerase sigma factor [Candidatus Eremiobacteraeota bacterium]|nr:sigma-70 family RNA polymerase sigma factor [Candidatus Eremiobacteraeota bacterium]